MLQNYQKYTIRSWQPKDRESAAEVIRTSLAEYGLGWEPDGADRDVLQVETYYLDSPGERLRQRGGEFWVIEADGSIVGTSAYQPYTDIAAKAANRGERAVEIRKMYLLPSARGQGLGRHLLGELERSIQSRDYHTIWIETASVLKAAVQLYEQNGYQLATGIETPRCDRVYIKRLKL